MEMAQPTLFENQEVLVSLSVLGSTAGSPCCSNSQREVWHSVEEL